MINHLLASVNLRNTSLQKIIKGLRVHLWPNKSVNGWFTQTDRCDLYSASSSALARPFIIISLHTRWTSCAPCVQPWACLSACPAGIACVPHNSGFSSTYPWPAYLILQREWEFSPYLWSFTPAPFQLYTADWLSWSVLRSQRVILAKQSTDTDSSGPSGLKLTSGTQWQTDWENVIFAIH